MKDRITTIMRHTRRWKYENGTAELILGGLFLEAGIALPFGIYCVSIALTSGMLIITTLGNWLQRRYIYPRSGFVEYSEDTYKGFWKSLLIVIVTIAFFGLVLRLLYTHDSLTALGWATPIVAVLAGILWLFAGLNDKLRRLVAIGVFSISLGVSLSPIVLGRQLTGGNFGVASLVIYLLIMSLTFFISGSVTLRQYLRQNPIPQEETK
jgi:hypothetical protein